MIRALLVATLLCHGCGHAQVTSIWLDEGKRAAKTPERLRQDAELADWYRSFREARIESY